MTHGPLQPVLRYLRHVLTPEGEAGVSDDQLLERFVAGHDSAAFELLVWRHGAMVWSVCRRLLPDAAAAEDAFQATFLVLVRKAGSIGKREAVGSWLHRVASRVALRARCTGARRAVREQTGLDLQQIAAVEQPPDLADTELPGILTEELSRLPEKYRVPVVLCYLEGKGYDEAARQLGCPKGTLSTRLTRARMLLRTRLARRGFAVSAALLAGELSARAAVPDILMQTTLRAGQWSAAGSRIAGFSAQAVALAQGVIHTMFLTRLKLTAGVLLLLSLIGSGAGVLGHRALAANAPDQTEAKGRNEAETKRPLLADDLEQLRRQDFRLQNRLNLLEEEIAWLRQDLDRLKARQPEGVRLRWRFEKGKPFFQKMITITEQKMKVQNQDVNQTQKQTWLFRWTPLEQDADGTWTFRLKTERVAADIELGEQKMSFDSTKAQGQGNNPLAEFFGALKDSEFTVTLNTKDGKITKVEGRKALFDKLNKLNPQWKPVLEQVLSEKTLSALFDQTSPLAVVPDKEVRKGDTWNRESIVDLGPLGQWRHRATYTYEGLDGKLSKVGIHVAVKAKEAGPAAPGLPFQLKQIKINSQQTSGAYWFDRQRGQLDHLELQVQLDGDLVIEIGGQATNVHLSQTQKMTIKVTDAPETDK